MHLPEQFSLAVTSCKLSRPLTQGELERLRQDFMIEFTYNSNAIEGNTLTLQETALHCVIMN